MHILHVMFYYFHNQHFDVSYTYCIRYTYCIYTSYTSILTYALRISFSKIYNILNAPLLIYSNIKSCSHYF